MSLHYGESTKSRRLANSTALAAFGVDATEEVGASRYRTIREGSGPSIFTIGYERRDGEDLVSALLDAGVDTLIDVRERPFSRKPDFRERALRASCEDAGIKYESWTRLGSTAHQRDELKDTGDLSGFMRKFRAFARRGRHEEIVELANESFDRTIALICYEREHEECHRCVVAELLADVNDASITAIL